MVHVSQIWDLFHTQLLICVLKHFIFAQILCAHLGSFTQIQHLQSFGSLEQCHLW